MRRIVVVGGGNAALCAAIAACEQGSEVVLLESAPFEARGGNSRFAGGGFRTRYGGPEDLLSLMPDLSESEIERSEFGTYDREQYYEDLCRLSQYRTDPALAHMVAEQSLPTLQWMRGKGVRFLPLYRRQSHEIDGKQRFWGGLTVEAVGGGAGLVDALNQIAKRLKVAVSYSCRATNLKMHRSERTVVGVVAAGESIDADAVVLACGGFESNSAWRARYLGSNWDLARVRGTRYNIGDGIRMALDVGAMPHGHWSGCHAVAWDLNAPDYGDLSVGDSFQKHSYPLGIMVNADGRRFVDEGKDFRNYTYASYGAAILGQKGHFAWQVFDAKTTPLLRDEYRVPQVTKVSSSSLEGLARQMSDVDANGFLDTVRRFNESVRTDADFNPSIKDGRCANDGIVAKSNWANPISTPPFEAYGVTCGITFTFGGLHIDENARVLNVSESPVGNLYAAGEIVGGLYYHNYPGGSGLTSGAVLGRIAGTSAALGL
ncbi:MAG: FAD-dependent tricarballylate dehydrogenase TcuA [Gammaproteobacteria bacterium]|nr:FAD-dependent tricarballylate dehydrogenase TcuA [Gammaproteobacteria bacterium]